jgi:hypothetical protein
MAEAMRRYGLALTASADKPICTLQDGKVEGMLNVHGTPCQVWYHTWHGAFVQMVEGDQE